MLRILKINSKNNLNNILYAFFLLLILVKKDTGDAFAFGISLLYSSFSVRDVSIAQGYFKTLPFSIGEYIKSMILDTTLYLIITITILYFKSFEFSFNLSFVLMITTWFFLAMFFRLNLSKNSKDFLAIVVDLLIVLFIWIVFSVSQYIIVRIVITLIALFLDVYRIRKLKKNDFE
ncbi:MAG: hypothetical protein RR565_00975 [Erysipelothrix sp.]